MLNCDITDSIVGRLVPFQASGVALLLTSQIAKDYSQRKLGVLRTARLRRFRKNYEPRADSG